MRREVEIMLCRPANRPRDRSAAYHTFGGGKRSAFGDANQHGINGVRFFTKTKMVTARWPIAVDATNFVMTVME